ncbi:MAG: menaquinone biosynthesis protein [Thermodesulfovibrionales bacterium]
MHPLANRRLKIGRIGYANLFPIFYALEKDSDCSNYEFIDGVPSTLNKLLRDGKIDISPSSSIEYLRHKDKYTILEGHSISSIGPIGSIFLFSRRPIETLDGLTVLVSSQSETSVSLLDIIFKKFYRINCLLKVTEEPFLTSIESYPAYLLIGDDAMKAVTSYELRVTELNSSPITHHSSLYVYDLGDIWYKKTGLPFVFALWIVRKDCCVDNPVLFEQFRKDLDAAKNQALKNLKAIARESPLRNILSEDKIVSYWRGISYDLTDEHMKGLELFRRYAEDLGLS